MLLCSWIAEVLNLKYRPSILQSAALKRFQLISALRKQPLLFLVAMQGGGGCCKLPLKTTKEDTEDRRSGCELSYC